MAQDHGLCREKGKSKINGPVHGPPLQARVAAANGTVRSLQTCCTNEDKLLALADNKPPALTNDPGAHGHEQVKQQKQMNGRGQSKPEWGQELDEGQWAWQAKCGRRLIARRTGTVGKHKAC